MELKDYSSELTKTFFGKKTNKMDKSEEVDNSSAVIDSANELSFDYLMALEENQKLKVKYLDLMI